MMVPIRPCDGPKTRPSPRVGIPERLAECGGWKRVSPRRLELWTIGCPTLRAVVRAIGDGGNVDVKIPSNKSVTFYRGELEAAIKGVTE